MSLSLPYSRNRRYLTGIDWFIGAMAYQSTRRNRGTQNHSQMVLDVGGFVSEAALRTILGQIADRFPLIHGRISRDWLNLAPYWKVTRRPAKPVIPLQVHDLPEDQADRAEQLLSDHLNAPFDSESQHLRFLLVRIGQKRSHLGLVFDHRLLDAIGAKMFFQLIDEAWRGRLDEIAKRVRQTEPAHLDHWMRRFRSGRTFNRLLIRLGKLNICGMNMPPAGSSGPNHILHESLSREESADLNRRAGEEIGAPILLPSALTRAVLAAREALPEMSLPGSQNLVFTSANMRGIGQEWETLFFNHVSFLPFNLEVQPAAGVGEMAVALRDQWFEGMKNKIPFAMEDAMALGRICPLWITGRLMRLVAKGRVCSFYFVCLRETGPSMESFMDHPTQQLIHQPLVFSPPGLNICLTEFRGSFNLVISYMRGVIDDAQARRLMQVFKALLLPTRSEPASR